jgi:hypothetical protein
MFRSYENTEERKLSGDGFDQLKEDDSMTTRNLTHEALPKKELIELTLAEAEAVGGGGGDGGSQPACFEACFNAGGTVEACAKLCGI